MLTKSLILAIMWTESSFNPLAVSSENAVGLLQVTPIAVKEVSQVFKLPGSPDLLDPAQNILYGILLLSKYSEEARNESELLATYNGGGRQRTNLRNGEGLASETAGYIVTVAKRRAYLDGLLRSEGPDALDRFPYSGTIDDTLAKLRRGGRWDKALSCNPGLFPPTAPGRGPRGVCGLIYPERVQRRTFDRIINDSLAG